MSKLATRPHPECSEKSGQNESRIELLRSRGRVIHQLLRWAEFFGSPRMDYLTLGHYLLDQF
jgi:hypothetical protein